MRDGCRMRWRAFAFGTALLVGLLSPALAQQKAQEQPEPVSSRERFSGSLELHEPGLAARGVRVDIRHWSIGERQRVAAARLTLEGPRTLTIYHLRAGELITVVDGNAVERRVGDFWTLRSGESMTFQTGDDSAIVETIVVEQD